LFVYYSNKHVLVTVVVGIHKITSPHVRYCSTDAVDSEYKRIGQLGDLFLLLHLMHQLVVHGFRQCIVHSGLGRIVATLEIALHNQSASIS
jgi:hypothetical protein